MSILRRGIILSLACAILVPQLATGQEGSAKLEKATESKKQTDAGPESEASKPQSPDAKSAESKPPPQEKPKEKPAEKPQVKPKEKPQEKPSEKEAKLAKTLESESSKALVESLINHLKWRTIGPGSMGGRIVDLAVNESDPNTYYVGTASGGVFKTTNNGVTFDPIFDQAGSISIGDVCIAPSDPNTVWVGTGEHNARNSVSWGDGVYKSIDAGKTWKHMGLKKTFQIGRIAIHPDDAGTVFVGACGRLWGPNPQRGLFRSEDGGKTWQKVLFVDDKTGCIDVAFHPDDPRIMLAAMYERQRDAYDGGNPAKRWGPGSGMYRSVDTGRTWSKITDGLPAVKLGRIGFGWSRSNPDTVYSIIESEKIGTAPKGALHPAYMGINGGDVKQGGVSLRQVLRGGPSEKAGLKTGDVVMSLAGGQVKTYDQLIKIIRKHSAGDKVKVKVKRGDKELTLELVFGKRPVRGGRSNRPFGASLSGQLANLQERQGPDGFETGGVFKSTDGGKSWKRVNSLNPRPFYYSQIHVDPGDDRKVYVLGIGLHMSDDGGKSFKSAGRGVHPDHHALWIDWRDGRHILLGCDGGMYVTYDRMKRWEFVHNLPIGQFYHVAVDTRPLYRVYGGLQDNGSWGGPSATRSRNGPTADDWYAIGGGDGFVCRIDPEDPDTVYCEMQWGRIWRVNIKTGTRASLRPPQIKGKKYVFNWRTPFNLSHHNPRIFYCAGNYVFRSLKRGDQLRLISPRLTKNDRASATALAESPLNPDVLYVGTDDGQLWVTTNGGHEWKNIIDSIKELPGPRRISSIEASRYKEGRVYVTFDGHYYDDDAAYVFVSQDHGKTWSSLRAKLPAVPVRTLREDLVNPDLLFLGTEFGAWASLDRGLHWRSINRNMPKVAVHEFALPTNANDLVAGTHGRGIWILDITALRQASSKVLSKPVHLYKSPQAVLWAGSLRRRLFGHKRFVGENPKFGAVLNYHLAGKTDNVSLSIVNASGQTVRRFKAAGDAGLHRINWDLRTDRRRNERFGRAAAPGQYQVVLKIGDTQYRTDLMIRTDPQFPKAPTMLQMQELEYETMMKEKKALEFTD